MSQLSHPDPERLWDMPDQEPEWTEADHRDYQQWLREIEAEDRLPAPQDFGEEELPW